MPLDNPLLDQLAATLALHRDGRLAAAEDGYRAVLALCPDEPTALRLLGTLLTATGRATMALPLLRRALVAAQGQPAAQVAAAHRALGDALLRSGRLTEAAAAYRTALDHAADDVGAHVNLSHALRLAGDIAGAGRAAAAALHWAPGRVEARAAHAAALLAAEDAPRAREVYAELLVTDPDFAPGWCGYALALLVAGEPEAALEAATSAIRLAPTLGEAWFVRGAVLRATGRAPAAAAALRRAIQIEPNHAAAHLALGNAELDCDRAEPAEMHIRQAIALQPALAEAHASLGFLLAGAGRTTDAIAACDAAIALRPDFAQAYWNRSFARLLAGDYPGGFADYEWRRRHPRYAADFATLPGPAWRGEDLTGRRLLVHAEQGFGDTIQFARFLPDLAARGAEVSLACPAPLTRLLRTVPAVSAVVDRAGDLPAHDLWVNQMSLPLLLGTTVETVPRAGGYLQAQPAPPRDPRGWPRARLVVGLVWAGNPSHSNDARRSIPIEHLAPLMARPGISWVNLQHGAAGEELNRRYAVPPSPPMNDFADTAALVAGCDLVIAVDTAVAHLAGALGVTVWTLLPHAPDWRWMHGREDTPWYASMRLFRQRRPGDWNALIFRVGAELDRHPLLSSVAGQVADGRITEARSGSTEASRACV